MSNAGLEAAIKSAGGKIIRTAVGDKNVIDEMLRDGFNFGGEQSGHLIFRDFGTTGDGLVAALQILRIMKAKRTPLSKLAKCWTRFPQLVTNVNVREKIPFEQLDGVTKLVGEAEKELKAAGRARVAALFRHGTQGAPAPGRPRRRDLWKNGRKKSAARFKSRLANKLTPAPIFATALTCSDTPPSGQG